MNRKEKIDLLQAVAAGKVSIDTLRNKRLKTVIRSGGIGNPTIVEFFIDDKPVSTEAYQKELNRQLAIDPNLDVDVKIVRKNESSSPQATINAT